VHALNRFVASLAHDVCCAELFSECDPVGMPAEDDDLLGAEAPRGDDATQADGAVSDNGHCLAWTDPRGMYLAGAVSSRVWEHLGWPFLIVLLVASVAALVYGALRSNPTVRVFAAVAIPTSLVMFVVSAYQRAVGTQMLWPAHSHVGGGSRYAIVPALLLVSVALVLVDRLSWRPGSRAATWLATAVIAVFALGAAASFDVANGIARGDPAWDEALQSAAATCVPDDEAVAVVPISPEGFGVVLPCDRLTAFSDGHAAR